MTVFICRSANLGYSRLLDCSLGQFVHSFCLDVGTGLNLVIAGMLMPLCGDAHEDLCTTSSQSGTISLTGCVLM